MTRKAGLNSNTLKLLAVVAMIVYEKKEIAWIWRVAFEGLCCILAYPGNWNFVAVIWIWGFGVFRDRPWKKWGMFLVGFGVHAALFFVVQTNGTLWTRFAVLAAIPLLLLYNGQRGRKSKWYQWGILPDLSHPPYGAVRHRTADTIKNRLCPLGHSHRFSFIYAAGGTEACRSGSTGPRPAGPCRR